MRPRHAFSFGANIMAQLLADPISMAVAGVLTCLRTFDM